MLGCSMLKAMKHCQHMLTIAAPVSAASKRRMNCARINRVANTPAPVCLPPRTPRVEEKQDCAWCSMKHCKHKLLTSVSICRDVYGVNSVDRGACKRRIETAYPMRTNYVRIKRVP